MVANEFITYPLSVGRWGFLATVMTTGTLEAPIINQLIYEKGNCQVICRGQFGTAKFCGWPQNVAINSILYPPKHLRCKKKARPRNYKYL